MYQQQVCRRLSTTGCSVCPRKKLLEDLHNQVTQWQSNGDSIIIMGDMNEDIWEDPVLSVATNMGVTDAVTTQHGNQSPNTHNRGSMPIDGIFLPTNLIQTIQLGYLAFGKGVPSNHRAIWLGRYTGSSPRMACTTRYGTTKSMTTQIWGPTNCNMLQPSIGKGAKIQKPPSQTTQFGKNHHWQQTNKSTTMATRSYW